ncbi:MAG: FAD-dependent oxidoreductase, partial [Rhodobacteraceae bacterium]|nr:FAD-dependent oxidoreductase [Paracoccaceae bacterium]
MTQLFRLPTGGLIDRSHPLNFTFNGAELNGYEGDTLASALLANGVHLVARSVKYHRPRGIFSAGIEEPNALVTIEDGSGSTPNLKATEVLLRNGLSAVSQNHWPGLSHDLGAALQIGARLMGAGFYYKTFKWPKSGWSSIYEKAIRRLAGHGRVDPSTDPGLYDKRTLHTDILVVGAGPAGLSAAVTAARGGASVVLLDQNSLAGGSLLALTDPSASEFINNATEKLAACPGVRVLLSTLAFGSYDHGLVLAVQSQPGKAVKEIFWKIRAQRIVLATGAVERPLVFPGNDRPGIMLAGSARTFIRRFGVKLGQRAVVAISDPVERSDTEAALRIAGIEIAGVLGKGDTILKTSGTKRISGLTVYRAGGRRQQFSCDLLCVSAGWTAAAHIFAHTGQQLGFDNDLVSLIPLGNHPYILPAGGARGTFNRDTAAIEGRAVAEQVLGELGLHSLAPANLPWPKAAPLEGIAGGPGKAFVDLQNDITRSDIANAVKEGYRDVELAKRYTTLGMGTDQGKTSWTNGILALAEVSGKPAANIGYTTLRPAWSPVSIGALVGADTGQNMTPVRRTPFQRAFEEIGCIFQTSGDWLYSRYFPRDGEDMATAINREVRAVRTGVGCVDMSTLAKIDVRGKDALLFLSRLYCNNFAKIRRGRLRYGLMLREDGLVFDDGTISCLSNDHFLVTATTANASSVWRHLQKCAQIDWPDLDVTLTSVTDHWASLAIAGPDARRLLQALKPDFATERDAFPFAAVRAGTLGGNLPARVFSVSFSGEMSYEINVPAGYAEALFNRVMTKGKDWNVTPYGLEALDVLRIEKGHLSVGTEIDGRRTPADLGMAGLVSDTKDFIGRALLERPALRSGRS